MAKNITRHVQHIKSVDTTTITVDGQDVVVAKLPEWGDLKDGEIAVNYNDGYETISIRNNNNEVVAFPNINTVNTLIDEKAQAALTFDSTPTANSTNPVTSGGIKTYVDAGDSIQSLTTYQSSTPLAVGDTHDQALSKLSKIIDDNEIITARALTDLNDTKQDEIDDLDEIRTGAALGATALQTETQLSKGTTTGNGNVVTDISVNDHQITLTKGATALTEHQSIKTVNGNTMVGTGDVSVGTITGITMNNVSKGTSGVVDLGTVITSETQLSKGTTSGDGNAVTDISVSDHQITLTKGATFLTEHQDLSAYADGAEYDSEEHLIYLKHGNTRLANPINAADFIKDGMVNSVRIDVLDDGSDSSDSSDDETRYLIVTFNTDAGLEDIEIPLSDIFDPSLYYTKEEIDEHELVTAAALTELHDTKADKIDYYTKDEIDELVDGNLDDYYTKQEVDEIAEEMALVTSAALNELNDTIEDIEVTIQNIQPELDFDDTPTAGSDNPVTSGGIKTYVDNAIGSLGNIVELNEPSVSTPLAVGDTYDQAFSKLTKIIRDNEFTTAGALTELYETKLEADDVYSKQEVDSMVEDKYAILNIDNFHEITDSGELNVNDVILNNCTNITDAKYITVMEPVNIGPSIQVQSYISDPRFYFVDYITISSGHSINITLIFNRTITQNGITKFETLTYTNSSLLLNDDGTSGTWRYNKEIVASKSMTEVTYSDLKILRNNGELTPGSYYRITDYQCTTTQEYTQSAGHQFDIVLFALSENKLAEEGWAMMHDNIYDVTFSDGVTKKCYMIDHTDAGDYGSCSLVDVTTLLGEYDVYCSGRIDETNKTIIFDVEDEVYSDILENEGLTYNYFQNSNLSAWKVWYCLDNDTARFAWANNMIDSGSIVDNNGNIYKRDNRFDLIEPGTSIQVDGVWYSNFYNWGEYYTIREVPLAGDKLYEWIERFGEIRDTGKTVDSYIQGSGEGEGRGVIYRLIDEWNNDVAYDFKNIQFIRPLTDGSYDVDEGTNTYCYTFTWVDENDNVQDFSIVGNQLLAPDDVAFVDGVFNNVIKSNSVIEGWTDDEFSNHTISILYDNVFISSYAYRDNGTADGVFSNYLCGCCTANTFGNNCKYNKFWGKCCGNVMGDSCWSNYIYNAWETTFGNNCSANIIKDGGIQNTLGEYCQHNVFGCSCSIVTLGDYCSYNEIGGQCMDVSLGSYNEYNKLGSDLEDVTLNKDYTQYVTVESGVKYVTLTSTQQTSSVDRIQNIIIYRGIAGTNNSVKSISHNTVNDAFLTEYKPANSQVINI